MVEASFSGLPVVASDVPAMRELLGNEFEIFFDPNEPESVAHAIRVCQRDARVIASQQRARAKCFSLDAHKAKLASLYRELGVKSVG